MVINIFNLYIHTIHTIKKIRKTIFNEHAHLQVSMIYFKKLINLKFIFI